MKPSLVARLFSKGLSRPYSFRSLADRRVARPARAQRRAADNALLFSNATQVVNTSAKVTTADFTFEPGSSQRLHRREPHLRPICSGARRPHDRVLGRLQDVLLHRRQPLPRQRVHPVQHLDAHRRRPQRRRGLDLYQRPAGQVPRGDHRRASHLLRHHHRRRFEPQLRVPRADRRRGRGAWPARRSKSNRVDEHPAVRLGKRPRRLLARQRRLRHLRWRLVANADGTLAGTPLPTWTFSDDLPLATSVTLGAWSAASGSNWSSAPTARRRRPERRRPLGDFHPTSRPRRSRSPTTSRQRASAASCSPAQTAPSSPAAAHLHQPLAPVHP